MNLFFVYIVYIFWNIQELNFNIILFWWLFFSLYFLFIWWYLWKWIRINPKNTLLKMEIQNTIMVFSTYIAIIIWLFILYEKNVIIFHFDLGWYLIPYTIWLIIYHDAFFYFWHRFMHIPLIYKYTHWEHHKSHFANYMSSYNFSFLESLIYVVSLLPIFFIDLNIYWLLIALFANDFVTILWHMWKEIAPNSYKKSIFYKIFVNTTYHDVHHTHNNGNYSAYFTFWDKILGTYSPSYDEKFNQVTK